jgi:hypothetical protein
LIVIYWKFSEISMKLPRNILLNKSEKIRKYEKV